MTPSKERVTEILAGKSSDSRAGDLRDLCAYIAAQDKRIAELEAGRAVVPELTEEDYRQAGTRRAEDDLYLRVGYNLAISRIRAIPSDRVLGEGEIKGTPEELAKIAESAGWKWMRSPIESKETKTLVEWMTEALRAQAGKDAA